MRKLIEIALIGIDGCGKTELSKKLVTALENAGKSAIYCTIKSNNNKLFCQFEEIYRHDTRMDIRYAGSTLDFLSKRMKIQALRQYDFVVWDRFYYCLECYASVLKIENDEISRMFRLSAPPNYVFYIDLQAATASERLVCRHEKMKITDNVEFQESLRAAYLSLEMREHFIKLDGTLEIDLLLKQILETCL